MPAAVSESFQGVTFANDTLIKVCAVIYMSIKHYSDKIMELDVIKYSSDFGSHSPGLRARRQKDCFKVHGTIAETSQSSIHNV